jgi:predicted ATPase
VYGRARVLCEETGEAAALFDVLEGLWGYHYVKADLAMARDLGHQLLSLAEQQRDGTLFLRAHTALGCTTASQGQFTASREHLDQALAFHDPARHLVLTTAWGADPGVIALSYQSGNLWTLGYPDQGVTMAERALAVARPQPHSFSMAWALLTIAIDRLRRGAMAEALAAAEGLVTLSSEQGFAQWLAQGMISRGAALSWLRPPAEAIPLLREALVAREATGARVARASFSVGLIGACLRAGQIEEGLAVVTDVLREIETTDERNVESVLWRLQGELLLARGPGDEPAAEDCLQKALAVARHQSARFMELTAATTLATLWQRRGERAAARALLEAIYGSFTEGFEYPALRSAQALLDELSAP